jgi:hypothetical protein
MSVETLGWSMAVRSMVGSGCAGLKQVAVQSGTKAVTARTGNTKERLCPIPDRPGTELATA